MCSKQCQAAASLIPKFKLHWTNSDNRDEIKHALLNYVSDNVEQIKRFCFQF